MMTAEQFRLGMEIRFEFQNAVRSNELKASDVLLLLQAKELNFYAVTEFLEVDELQYILEIAPDDDEYLIYRNYLKIRLASELLSKPIDPQELLKCIETIQSLRDWPPFLQEELNSIVSASAPIEPAEENPPESAFEFPEQMLDGTSVNTVLLKSLREHGDVNVILEHTHFLQSCDDVFEALGNRPEAASLASFCLRYSGIKVLFETKLQIIKELIENIINDLGGNYPEHSYSCADLGKALICGYGASNDIRFLLLHSAIVRGIESLKSFVVACHLHYQEYHRISPELALFALNALIRSNNASFMPPIIQWEKSEETIQFIVPHSDPSIVYGSSNYFFDMALYMDYCQKTGCVGREVGALVNTQIELLNNVTDKEAFCVVHWLNDMANLCFGGCSLYYLPNSVYSQSFSKLPKGLGGLSRQND